MRIHAKDSKGNILATVDTCLPQPMICGCVAVSDDGNLFQIIERNCYTHLLGSNRSTIESAESLGIDSEYIRTQFHALKADEAGR